MTENEAIKMLEQGDKYSHEVDFTYEEYLEAIEMGRKALEEIQQYRAIGTVEELKDTKEKLQGYKNQMSIYAEQHKVILASDVLDMLEELDWSE